MFSVHSVSKEMHHEGCGTRSMVESLCLESILKAIACTGHGKMKMNRFIIEHLGLLRVVVVICNP